MNTQVRQLLIAAALCLMVAGAALAQPQTPSWALSPDSAAKYVNLETRGSKAADPAGFAQSYQWEMVYDSICHVNYLATEVRLNGRIVILQHWKNNRLVHANDDVLAWNSRTAVFPIRPGDTISFYRELRWYHPFTNWQDTNTYYASDTLEWMAHLVRARDLKPLATIDSTGILPRTTMGAPFIYSAYPMMAIVQYVVPVDADPDSVFIGFGARAGGDGKYFFTRLDNYTFSVSKRLNDPFWQRSLVYFDGNYAKRLVLNQESDDTRFTLNAGVSGRDIEITCMVPQNVTGRLRLGIYDVSGVLLYSPAYVPGAVHQITAGYHAPDAGVYIIVLFYGDRVVRTTKITVQ